MLRLPLQEKNVRVMNGASWAADFCTIIHGTRRESKLDLNTGLSHKAKIPDLQVQNEIMSLN